MRNVYAVMFRENKIIIKSKKREKIIEYKFDDIKTYPNVPYYTNLFQEKIDINKVRKDLNKSFGGNISKINFILGPHVVVAWPDDATDVDKKVVSEFTMELFKILTTIIPVAESTVLAPIEEQNYISIYRSCRMIAFTYNKGREIAVQKFIENKDYTVEEMRSFINGVHDDCVFKNLNVYLNGEGMEKYSMLGEFVEKERVLDNMLMLSESKVRRRK